MRTGTAIFSIWIGLCVGILVYLNMPDKQEKSSSYTQWNQNTYQINDTLFVITAEGDTAKFILKQ